ncbi:DUF1707 domain-containing protein [Amycolatopsis samaneae]|uniref:DUF1707 domain-containing protein n=1 Tax=Amycolatopsis samaneae TaxID=664691 RepID=A0ABW5GFW7_9PSEU
MTWQEDLRRLDEALASGSLTADEYRTRRDQVLSMAVTPEESHPAQPQQAQGGPGAGETQIIPPVAPPSPPQGQSASEATQVVSAADAASAERTQAVAPWQMQQHQQQRPQSPAGGFQQPNLQSPPGGFPPPQQQPGPAWNAPQNDVSPPWGGSDFPPLAPTSNSDWVSQGPESFQTTPSSGKGKKIAIAVVAVVVLAGAGVGAWALFGNDSGGSNPPVAQSSSQPPAPPTSKALPEPPAAKPEPASNEATLTDLPGTPRNGGGAFDLAKLQSGKLLSDSVTQRLKEGGMTEGLLKTNTDDSVTLGLYALAMPDTQSASKVAIEYANAQQEGGLPLDKTLSLRGVQVYASPNGAEQSVFRAVYVVYGRTVIVESYGANRASALKDFQTVLNAQIAKAPPTQRDN